jgi:hypothetical protein
MANLTILEPMSAGDVIDRAVRLYRRNFLPLIAIVTIPSLIGYVSSMMFWYGYTSLFMEFEPGNPRSAPSASTAFIALGGLGYPVWFFALLFTVCGLTRVVADHVMLGEPITFRKCFASAWKRVGDILLMGLLLLVAFFVLYIVFSIVLFVAILIMGAVAGVTAVSQAPRWLAAAIITITVLAVLALGIWVLLLVLARIAFIPQVVMIEGEKAGSSIGRAIRLGGKNWHKIGAIVLFIYFVQISLLAALTLPLIAGLELAGALSTDFFISPTWNLLYTSFSQLSNILVLPMWSLTYTLLYFDSRVRKEAYDLELLARELSPGFYWTQSAQPASFGYQPAGAGPVFQSSPLGLGGYSPAPPQMPFTPGEGLRSGFDQPTMARPVEPVAAPVFHTPAGQPLAVPSACARCGLQLEPRAKFCIRCGTSVV